MLNVATVLLNSAAEVKGHFSDVIFFQGCKKNCSYCFNKELIPFESKTVISAKDLFEKVRLSKLSRCLVLTGGEPIEQDGSELYDFIALAKLRYNYVILETARSISHTWDLCDKIIFSIKDDNLESLKELHAYKKAMRVIVVGYEGFTTDLLEEACKITTEPIWIKYAFPKCTNINKIYKIIKNHQKDYLVMDKICL